MNKNEAEELNSGKAFHTYHDQLRDNFQSLKEILLTDKGINNWINHYQESPEQWQPFHQTDAQKKKNIEQLIKEIFINSLYK